MWYYYYVHSESDNISQQKESAKERAKRAHQLQQKAESTKQTVPTDQNDYEDEEITPGCCCCCCFFRTYGPKRDQHYDEELTEFVRQRMEEYLSSVKHQDCEDSAVTSRCVFSRTSLAFFLSFQMMGIVCALGCSFK